MKLTEGYPVYEFKCRIHDLEETPLHTAVKNMVAFKLKHMTPQELNGSETWEEANKKFPINEYHSEKFDEKLIYNHIPRQDYNNKVYLEKDFVLGGVFIKPDVCTFNFKPLSIFEIIVTSKPKIDKLIALIEEDVNVIFIYSEEVIIDLSRNFNIHRNWASKFKCFTGWSATDSLATKVSRAVDMLIADKFPAKNNNILGKKIIKDKDVYTLHIKTESRDWRSHLGSRTGKPTSTLNQLLKYYTEKIDPTSEEISYDDNTMTVEFAVKQTLPKVEWSDHPFHVGTILKATQGGRTMFTNRETAIVNQTNYTNIKDGEKVHFTCGVRNYVKNGYNKYYANSLAGKRGSSNVWMLE